MYDHLITVLDKHLPNATRETGEKDGYRTVTVKQKGGLFSRNNELKISYRERITPGYKLNQTSCPLEENLAGMLDFVSSIPATDTQVKELFEDKIVTINSEMLFSAPKKYSSEAIAVLKDLLKKGEPFVFAQPGKFFRKSETQHFLNHELQLILDIRGNTGIEDLAVNIDEHYFKEEPKVSAAARKRKLDSEAILVPKGIKINMHLPAISEAVKLRSQWEVIDRIYALLVVSSKGSDVSEEQLLEMVKRYEITHFSDAEQAMMAEESLSDQQKDNARWRYESLFMLMWAAGLVDMLPYPSVTAPSEQIIKRVLGVSREQLGKQVEIRPVNEILDMVDLVYRMNWACMEARVKHRNPTGNLNASVVYERHYALNWLISYEDAEWDHVSTDT